jgi:hypothetical protein
MVIAGIEPGVALRSTPGYHGAPLSGNAVKDFLAVNWGFHE